MTNYHSMTFADFTSADVSAICGPCDGPRLPAAQPEQQASISLAEAMATMLRNRAAELGFSGFSATNREPCVTGMLWWAINEPGALVDGDGGDPTESCAARDHAVLLEQITGLAPSRVPRFIVGGGEWEPEVLSESQFHEVFDAACAGPEHPVVHMVDLAALGIQFAQRAGCPLVTLR